MSPIQSWSPATVCLANLAVGVVLGLLLVAFAMFSPWLPDPWVLTNLVFGLLGLLACFALNWASEGRRFTGRLPWQAPLSFSLLAIGFVSAGYGLGALLGI